MKSKTHFQMNLMNAENSKVYKWSNCLTSTTKHTHTHKQSSFGQQINKHYGCTLLYVI